MVRRFVNEYFEQPDLGLCVSEDNRWELGGAGAARKILRGVEKNQNPRKRFQPIRDVRQVPAKYCLRAKADERTAPDVRFLISVRPGSSRYRPSRCPAVARA